MSEFKMSKKHSVAQAHAALRNKVMDIERLALEILRHPEATLDQIHGVRVSLIAQDAAILELEKKIAASEKLNAGLNPLTRMLKFIRLRSNGHNGIPDRRGRK